MATILGANSVTGYDVDHSLRFNGGSTDFLTTTQTAVTSERKKFTISCWVKRSLITSGNQTICSAGNGGGSEEFALFFKSTDAIEVYHHNGSSYEMRLITKALYQDPSAWYHIVFVCDTANGTAALRQRLFVNGVELTDANSDFSTYDESPQNDNLPVNVDERFQIGSASWGNPGGGLGTGYNLFSGYIAEFYQTAGQANVATVFGEYDEDSPTIWKPKNPSGLSFGTNGIRLEFKGTGTSANSSGLGADTSGNDNHLTVNNLTAVDQSTDTCTNNFCTLNPLTARGSSGTVLSEGCLQYAAVAGAGDSSVFATMAVSPGMKVYFEVKLVQNTAQNSIGIHNLYDGGDGDFVKGGSETGTYSFKTRGASSVTQYFNNGSSNNHSVNNAANDTILGVAIDNENGQIHYSLDGTFINSSDPTDNNPVALVTGFGGSTEQYIHTSLDTSGGTEPINQFNFGSPIYSESGGNSDANGHGNFNQAVPSGYFALNSKNLAEHG